MKKIIVDRKDIKRIQRYIKRSENLYLQRGRYSEEDFKLLVQKGQLTERLARQIIPELMEDANITREFLEPNGEFQEQVQDVFNKFDTILDSKNYEQYVDMDIDEMYSRMQLCLDLRDVEDKIYMCRDLRRIANEVINSINGIDNYLLDTETREELEKIQEELKNLVGNNITDIQGIQDRIDKYNEYARRIWNDYITDVDVKEETEFRYIVHNLTGGEIQGNFEAKYMSASLVTNNTMGLYGGTSYGFIIRPKHIISASDKDTFTNNYREDGEELFKIKPSLKLPKEIEESCVQQTIEINGEMLNYDFSSIYSEIVVDEYEIIGVFVIDNGEKELSSDYEMARKIAEERRLPLKEIDISKYRMDKGLEAIQEEKRERFCKNLLTRLCDKNGVFKEFYIKCGQMFSNKYYQQFYERYMAKKEMNDFSIYNILEIVVELSEKDEKIKLVAGDLKKYCAKRKNANQGDNTKIGCSAKRIGRKEDVEEYGLW